MVNRHSLFSSRGSGGGGSPTTASYINSTGTNNNSMSLSSSLPPRGAPPKPSTPTSSSSSRRSSAPAGSFPSSSLDGNNNSNKTTSSSPDSVTQQPSSYYTPEQELPLVPPPPPFYDAGGAMTSCVGGGFGGGDPYGGFSSSHNQQPFANPFWDLDDSSAETGAVNSGGAHHINANSPSTKMCFPANTLFRNKKKVASTDVASVGNASDTLVAVNNSNYSSSGSSNSNSKSSGSGNGNANGTPSGSGGGVGRSSGMASGGQIVLGRDLHESAKMHLNRREYDKALDNFEAILQAQIQRFGPVHPSVAAAMHNVGVCRQRMQQFALAANLLQEAVQIRKQTLGDNHLEVAVSLSKLGTAQAALGQYEQAFTSLREAISISKRELGYEHKTTAQMLCHLACFYFETNELYAAEATFLDAYEIYQSVYSTLTEGRDACMAQMTDTLCNIGSIQNRRKRHNKAIETFQSALDLQLGIMGCDHPLVVATLDNLAYAYSKNKDYAKALSCYQKMFKAQCKASFDEACLETFRKQMVMYDKLKKSSEALETAKNTLRLAKSMLPSDDEKLASLKKICDEYKKKFKKNQTSS